MNRDSKASTGRGRIDTGMTSLISAFLLPGFKLDGGKTSSGKQVDDKGSGRSLLGPHGPTLSVDGLSTLQFPDVEPMGHSSVFWRMWKACSGHSSVFHGWTFWTVFHGWTWLDTLQFFDMVPSVWRQSSRSGHFSWEHKVRPLFRFLTNIREASLRQSKLLGFGLGHLRDRTWNISGDMGLVSAGRINKDTPPLTTPSHTSKSSAMDISSHIFQIEIHGATQRRFRRGRGPTSYDMRPEAYLYARKMREGRYHRFLARILT